jgi:hypothetical protein
MFSHRFDFSRRFQKGTPKMANLVIQLISEFSTRYKNLFILILSTKNLLSQAWVRTRIFGLFPASGLTFQSSSD